MPSWQEASSRRSWKLQATKAFSKIVSTPIHEIRSVIGARALDALFNEAYLLYPNDPAQGAVSALFKLKECYGEKMRDMSPHFERSPPRAR